MSRKPKKAETKAKPSPVKHEERAARIVKAVEALNAVIKDCLSQKIPETLAHLHVNSTGLISYRIWRLTDATIEFVVTAEDAEQPA